MATKLEIRSIGDEVPFDLGPSEALAFDYHYKTPETSQAKSNWTDSYLTVHGKIHNDIPDPNPVLPPWANTIWTPKNSMVEYYRDVTIEETRAGASVRKIRFPKAYVIEYREYASDQKGEMGFSLLLGQKKDCQGEIELDGEPVSLPQEEANSESDTSLVILSENVASGATEKSIPTGSGKNGKLTIKEIEDEFAKAAGYDSFADLIASEKKSSDKLSTSNRWKYKLGEEKYGGPVDCAGLFTAIAGKYGQNYSHLNTGAMKNEKNSPYNFNEIPTKNGKPDFSQVPEGVILYKPGHVGLYVGNEREISAKTASLYGSQKVPEHTSSRGAGDYLNSYTHWSYIPFVDYSSSTSKTPAGGKTTK